MVNLDYRDPKPIYAQIVDQFISQIGAGILQQGDKLPSVRELATQLAINPNTIQRAYRELENRGLIATAAGKGCFVCGTNDETDRLWREFDEISGKLLGRGISVQQLLEHLIQGGKNHAPNE